PGRPTQFQRARGWAKIVPGLLAADGDIAKNPQTAFVMANSEDFRPRPNLLAGSAARLFLGVQLRCAECHDHPFAPWKQSDFWGTAAFFGRLRNTGKKGPPFILTEKPDTDPPLPKGDDPVGPRSGPGGTIKIPASSGKASGQVVKARFLGGEEPKLNDEEPYRPVFVAWATAKENRYFAPALVNRTWAQLFGRGFVNPVDDFRDDNPPSNPALLQL